MIFQPKSPKLDHLSIKKPVVWGSPIQETSIWGFSTWWRNSRFQTINEERRWHCTTLGHAYSTRRVRARHCPEAYFDNTWMLSEEVRIGYDLCNPSFKRLQPTCWSYVHVFSLFLDNIQVVHINSNNCYSIVPSLHVFRAYAVLRGPCFPETPHWTIRVAGGQYFFTSRKFKIPLTRTLECVRFVWIYSLWSQLWNQLSLFSGSLWWERWECWIYAASFDDF